MAATYERFMDTKIDLVADGNTGSPALDEALEALVDRFNISTICEVLSVVAGAKGEHLRSNWQDERTAKVWDRVARQLDKVSATAIPLS